MTAAFSPADHASSASPDSSAVSSATISGAALPVGVPGRNKNLRLTWKAVITGQSCPRKLWNQYHEAMMSEEEDSVSVPSENTGSDIMPLDVPAVIRSNAGLTTIIDDRCREFDALLKNLNQNAKTDLVSLETLRLSSSDQIFEGIMRIYCLNGLIVTAISPLEKHAPEEQRLILKFHYWLMTERGRHCDGGLLRDPLTGLTSLETFSEEEMTEFRKLMVSLKAAVLSDTPPAVTKTCARCSRCPDLDQCASDAITPGIADFENMSDEERQLYLKNDYEKYPLFVCTQGSRISVTGKCLIIQNDSFPEIRKPLAELSALVLVGGINLTTPCLKTLGQEGIPAVFTSTTGKCHAVSVGPESAYKNAAALKCQVETAQDPEKSIAIARSLVAAKIMNQVSLIRKISREACQSPKIKNCIAQLNRLAAACLSAKNIGQLMGLEGEAASSYFDNLAEKISESGSELTMNGRNRRPPRDPVNALISFGYALLLQNVVAALKSCGLCEWLGVLHTERSGKPSLALDLMEEFRSPVVDALMVTIVRKNIFKPSDFEEKYDNDNERYVSLTENSRKKFISLFQRRLDTLCTHRLSGRRCSWRESIYLQAGVFLRTIRGDLTSYVGMEF